MNTVLWSQGVTETDPGHFVIDGNYSRYSNTNKEQEEVLILMNTSQFKTLKRHRDGDGTSPSFVVKSNDDWYYLEGNFKEKDTSERLRVFRFMTNLKKSDDVIRILTEYANKMGCTVNDDDLKQLKKTLKISLFGLPSRKILLIIFALLVGVVATITIINNQQSHRIKDNNQIEKHE